MTVWVKREDDRYTGTVGVGDFAGAQQGDFANLHRGPEQAGLG